MTKANLCHTLAALSGTGTDLMIKVDVLLCIKTDRQYATL